MFTFQLSLFSVFCFNVVCFFSSVVVQVVVLFLFFSRIVLQRKIVLNETKQQKREQEQLYNDTTAIQDILNELLMLNERKTNVKNDRSRTYSAIIDDVIINHGIVHTNEHNNFMNEIFYICDHTFDWTDWHYSKTLNVLTIVVRHIFHLELLKQCVWQTEYVRRRSKEKKIKQKCKDNVNHRIDHNNSDVVCVSIFKNMDIFLNQAKCYQSGNINKMEVDDGAQYVDVKISVMITRSRNNVSNEIRRLLLQMQAFCDGHLFHLLHHFARKVDKMDYVLKQLEGFVCDVIIFLVTGCILKRMNS